MPFVDPKLLGFSSVSAIRGPAICLPLDKYAQSFFVTGGDDSYACFLDGNYAGHAMRTDVAGNFEGMAVGPVEIEVDLASAYNPNETAKRPLTIVRQGGATGIYCVLKQQGHFDQTITAVIEGAMTPETASQRVAFSRWRAVVGTGDDKEAVFSFDADAAKPSLDL